MSAYLLTIGIGYLIAILLLFLIEIGPRQKVSVDMLQATIHKYYGNRGTSRIEAMLRGSMGQYATTSDKIAISAWVDEGSREHDFPMVKRSSIRIAFAAIAERPELAPPPFTTYEDVKKVIGADLGESFSSPDHFFTLRNVVKGR